MLACVCRLTILLLLIGVTTAAAQEPEKKPESISTEPKLLVVELKTAEGKTVKISGEAVFTIEAANSDDTMSGRLSYAISGESREEVARVINKPLQEVPTSITVNDVIGNFEKIPSCPDLHFEFSAMEFEVTGAKAHLDRFKLTFKETTQVLSQLLCRCAKAITNGRSRCPHGAINRILKGED